MSTGVEERTTPLDQGLLSGRKRELALLVLILLSAGALHVAAVRKPFFADDYFFLEQVRGRSLPAALVAPDPLGNFLRPVSRQAYFWTVSRLGHESPVVFHLAGLLIFLMSLLVFNRFARLLGGSAVALTATALLGFSYAADVPLRWASGSQDLLALLFATAAILLHVKGRHVLGAVLLLLGLLSKETVALAAMVAIVADRRAGETWRDPLRRGAWLVGATLLWGAVWIGTSSARPAGGHALSLAPANILATLAHLVQVALGLEFRAGGSTFGHSTPVAALTGIAGAALVWLASSPPPPERCARRGISVSQ